MVGAVRANVLAHFDRIFWRGYTLGHRFEELVCGTAAREALCAAVENGYALELNSRLLGVSPQWHDLLLLLLSWYKAAGGDHVLVNSDAHSTRQIGLNYHLANDLLHQAGLRARSSVPQREAI